MSFNRREFLTFLGIGITTTACGGILQSKIQAQTSTIKNHSFTNFQPIKYPIPLEIDNLNSQQQKQKYQNYKVEDDLVLPEGFKYDVIASWGDRVGDSRFGYNNDYVSFVETNPNEGFLVVNFEYVSPTPWLQSYEMVLQKSLSPEVLDTLAQANQNRQALNIFALPDDNPAKIKFQEFFGELLIDQGIGIISVKKDDNGKWQRTYSKLDRRITGISGWKDNRYLSSTGVATLIFKKSQGLGYIDNLGDKIIGTFANCAGGTSPWGTVFSAEENFQSYVPEGIMADGTSLSPEFNPVSGLSGQGNPFGLAGNKYGWMVEVDPSNPNDYGTKHTWLGRFRHEAVAIRAEKDQPLVFYSGCDRTGGHLYKFVSKGKVINPTDKKNSALLQEGMLYVAKMSEDGKGEWIPLQPDTPINPIALQNLEGGLLTIPNPDRKKGSYVAVNNQTDLDDFATKYKTLGELYVGENQEEIQGIILIDAHYCANIVGGTCGARPEDVELSPIDRSLVIAYTAGVAGSEGSPDKRIFSDRNGKMYQYGCLMRLVETDNKPDAMTFTWEILGVGGEPSMGGMGFANPDNLEFDAKGDLWMVTDMPQQNQAPKDATSYRSGLLGNNSIWYIPLSGENAGKAYPFGITPMEAEACGIFFTKDQQTLFLAIQHPGERKGIRKNMEEINAEMTILTTNGEEFQQKRTIPQGSNWPSLQANQPPKPSLVAIST